MNQTEENNTIDKKGDVNMSRHVEQPNLASIMNRLEKEEKERQRCLMRQARAITTRTYTSAPARPDPHKHTH